MNLAMLTLGLHVLVAVLGIGLIGALPLAAWASRRGGLALGALSVWALPLLRAARISLFLAFISGAALDIVSGGPFHHALWFRLAALLVVATAICLARVRAALARALSGALAEPVALRRIEYWGFTSVIAVACIVLLMEWKPF
jgi:hypothetical protein